MRTQLPLLVSVAAAAALVLGACDGGVQVPAPPAPPSGTGTSGTGTGTSGSGTGTATGTPGAPTALPTEATSSVPAGSVDCTDVVDIIEGAMRPVISGVVEVQMTSSACQENEQSSLHYLSDTFDVTVTLEGSVTADELVNAVDAAAGVWQDPEVQGVAPNLPALFVQAPSLLVSITDGFQPLGQDVADRLANLSEVDDLTYYYRSEMPGRTLSGIPFGTISLESFVSVTAKGQLDDPGLQSLLEGAWPGLADLANESGLHARVSFPAGELATVSIPLSPADDFPDDATQFARDLDALAVAAGAMSLSASPPEGNDLRIELHMDYWDPDLDPAIQAEADRLVQVAEAWVPGAVTFSHMGPLE